MLDSILSPRSDFLRWKQLVYPNNCFWIINGSFVGSGNITVTFEIGGVGHTFVINVDAEFVRGKDLKSLAVCKKASEEGFDGNADVDRQ